MEPYLDKLNLPVRYLQSVVKIYCRSFDFLTIKNGSNYIMLILNVLFQQYMAQFFYFFRIEYC